MWLIIKSYSVNYRVRTRYKSCMNRIFNKRQIILSLNWPIRHWNKRFRQLGSLISEDGIPRNSHSSLSTQTLETSSILIMVLNLYLIYNRTFYCFFFHNSYWKSKDQTIWCRQLVVPPIITSWSNPEPTLLTIRS